MHAVSCMPQVLRGLATGNSRALCASMSKHDTRVVCSSRDAGSCAALQATPERSFSCICKCVSCKSVQTEKLIRVQPLQRAGDLGNVLFCALHMLMLLIL